MNEINPSSIMIDENGVASWNVSITTRMGTTYQGLFQFNCALSPLQLIEADRNFRELLGKNAEFAASYVEGYAYALTQLKQRIVKAPPFWDDGSSAYPGGQIKDEEILTHVFKAAKAAEDKFRKELDDRHKNSLKAIQEALQKHEEEARLSREMEEGAIEKPKKSKGKKNDKP